MITGMEVGAGEVVGRAAELAAVQDFLIAAGEGFAQLTLEGEPGIGKTTVWQEALRRAVALGIQVMQTRPSESEATLSFVGLADLFNGVGEGTMSRLPLPQGEAISVALLRTPVPPRGVDERALFASALTLLRLMAAEGPLLLAVDDVQWLDSPSAHVLSFAVRRLRAEPIGLLLTARTGAAWPSNLDRAAERGLRRSVRLGPLSLAALHEVIKQRTQRALPRPVMVQVARVSGGNALYAVEIAAELAGRAVEGSRLPVPSRLTDLVAARVGRLQAAGRRALLAAAALAQPTTDLVDAAALAPAVRAGVVSIEQKRIRFVHPLFSAAVYGGADEVERRGVHRRLAEAVSDPEERARHAALSATQPDAAIAEALDAAAWRAGSRGATDAAAELLELAVGLTPEGQAHQRAERLVRASRFWFDAGDMIRSQAVVERALGEALPGDLHARALLLLGQLHGRRSSFTQAAQVAVQALEMAGDDPELRAGIELDLTYYCVSLGDLPGAERHAQAAVAAAEGSAAPGALADALAVHTIARFLCGRGVDGPRIHRALELEEPTRVRAWQNRPIFIHGLLLLWTGRAEEALSAFGRLQGETLERGEESPIPFLCMYMAWACLWHGDFAAAAGFADQARETAALLDDPAGIGMALAASALVHAHDGSGDLARQEALEAVGCFRGLDWPSGTIWPLWALGLAELADGKPEAVHAALGPLAELLPTMGAGDPVLGVFLPVEIEALVELGELAHGEALVQWLERRGRELDRPWALAVAGRCRGLVCAARGDLDGALAALLVAVAEHDRMNIPFERARTLLVLGQLRRRRGEPIEASASLVEAHTLFERMGTPIWAERTRRELERIGRRPARAGSLTPTEARVAELAASGLANREIGARVFLSTKGVEANLTRVYAKLGIRSRGGLARALVAGRERRKP